MLNSVETSYSVSSVCAVDRMIRQQAGREYGARKIVKYAGKEGRRPERRCGRRPKAPQPGTTLTRPPFPCLSPRWVSRAAGMRSPSALHHRRGDGAHADPQCTAGVGGGPGMPSVVFHVELIEVSLCQRVSECGVGGREPHA